MSLTQVQIIQSLGEALSWLEKELSWGTKPAELNHLTGRIGELYAAMITRGQMALETNQRGYDVISDANERISVKTITSSHQVSFNPSTLHHVDRIMILRINVDVDDGVTIECLFDKPIEDARPFLGEQLRYMVKSSGPKNEKPIENLAKTASASFEDLMIDKFENGTIQVSRSGNVVAPARPILKEIAGKIGIDILFESGAEKNTRHLGASIIKQLNQT
jgi:hypothetical protein